MGRRKRKSANQGPTCSVCQVSYSSSSTIIPRCSACNILPKHTICDACFHKHIFYTVSKDITSQVICPTQGCDMKLSKITIQTALSSFGYQNLWDDYVLRSTWRGTSEQWIKRFSLKCPRCRVPIEKNGGCDHMSCRQCVKMQPFGGNPMGGGFPPQFPGAFPPQGFGQYGSGGGFYGGGAPSQGGNPFPGGSPFPPPGLPPPPPMGGQMGQGFGFPPAPSGFGYQQPPYAPPFTPGQQPPFGAQFPAGQQPPFGAPFPAGQQPPFGAPFPAGQQPPFGAQFPAGQQLPFGAQFPAGQQPAFGAPFPAGQQPPYGNANYFGSGNYGQPRSRHSSRHRSRNRRHRHQTTSSSSSSDDHHHQNRGSPYRGRDNPYANVQPLPNMPPVPPHSGSPVIPPRRAGW